MAIAIQNLVWGVSGMLRRHGWQTDLARFGSSSLVLPVLYALGLVSMGYAHYATAVFSLGAGVLIGMAQAGTTYAVIYGVIGRNVAADKRSWAMGVAAAAGSFGQFLMVPTEGFLIGSQFGWQQALVVLGLASLLMIPMAWGLREPGFGETTPADSAQQSIAQALQRGVSIARVSSC
jgi:hypothetical protein